MEIVRKGMKDILAGSVFIVFGLYFALTSLTYEIGSPLNMGPGYFPLVLGGLLVLLGAIVVVKGLVTGEGESIGTIPWRSMVLIVAAIIFFGVRGLQDERCPRGGDLSWLDDAMRTDLLRGPAAASPAHRSVDPGVGRRWSSSRTWHSASRRRCSRRTFSTA